MLKSSRVIAIAVLVSGTTALAQPTPPDAPAPQPAPQPVPPPDTAPPDSTVPPVGDGTQPPDTTVAPPVAPLPPPPPTPSLVAGLVPSVGGDQRLLSHERAFDRETPVPDRVLTASVFADYWFQIGPRLGGSVGIYRAFEFHIGAVLDTLTTMQTGGMSTSTTETRIFYGGNLAMFSYRGVQLAGGALFLTGNGDTKMPLITGTLGVQLDAHWLPFKVPNARLRVGYPIGIGIEWGKL